MMSYSIVFLLVLSRSIVDTKKINSDSLPNDISHDVRHMDRWSFDLEKDEESGNAEYTVCQTDACKILAKQILKGMNKSVDPCEDFYAYTCGTWNSPDIIPSYEMSWGNTAIFQRVVYHRIKGILESDPEPTDILPVRQAKKWYGSCMNVEDREKRGIKPIESILMHTGGWPMVIDREEWDADEYSWQKIEKHYFYIAYAYTLYGIAPSYKNSDDRTGQIMLQPGYLSSVVGSKIGPMTFSGKHYKAYEKFVTDIAKVFIRHNRADVSDEMLKKDITDLLNFEKNVFEMSEVKVLWEESTVGEFIDAYNENVSDIGHRDRINFKHLFKRTFDLEEIDINDSTPIFVIAPDYFVNLTKLLKETPTRIIANYLHWDFVSNMLGYTTDELGRIVFQFSRAKMGLTGKQPRWLECVKTVNMDHATSYAFVKKYFEKSLEKTATEMIDSIRREMSLQIDKSNWLDEESKEISKEKLNSMKIFLGFPDWYKNRTAVMNSYKGMKIGYDYFENVLNFKKYQVKLALRGMKQEHEEEPWASIAPVVVNAVYGAQSNTIKVPAADFQPPLFTPQLPQSINYGMTGGIVGHEIGHGFDDTGITYGKDGNKTKLSNQIIEMYYKRAECFLDQYNEYLGVTESIYEESTSDREAESFGRRTRGENIADTTGLHAVFQAYRKKLEKESSKDTKLPGLEDYTDEQMFFIAFGTIWCTAMRPEFVEMAEKFDTHSPPRLRVIGAVSNTNDFSKAFNCQKGSPMNPEDKCNIWKGSGETREKHRHVAIDRRRHSRWDINWEYLL